MSERQKLELSFSGLAAGALATVTATVVASFFGAYGTIIGAAASSVVSTAGAAIYQHFFRRTGDKLKEAAQVGLRGTLISERGGAVSIADPRQSRQRRPEQPERPPRPEGRTESRSARPSKPRTLADIMGESQGRTTARIGDETRGQAEEAAAGASSATGDDGGDATRNAGAFGDRPSGAGTSGAGAFGETGGAESGGREDGTRVMGAAADDETNLAGTDDAETMAINRMTGVSGVYTSSGVRKERPSLGAMLGWATGRWKILLGTAVAVFVVVMGAVTIAEVFMDKPLSAAVTGQKAHGYTLTGGNGGSTTDTPTETPSESGSPNPTESSSENPGNTAPSTPNPRQTAQNTGGPSQAPQQTAPPSRGTSPQPTTTNNPYGTGNDNNAQGQTQAPATQ